jgi:alkanesulfonate monooxygenase
VAEALVDYYDLGVTTFLIRGFDPLDDAIDYGRELLPLTRRLIAERQAASTGTDVALRHRIGKLPVLEAS